LEQAITRRVAFVPGRDFFPTEGGRNYLRLNFSHSPPEQIREGVHRLATLCRELR
jgi:2-aminoadipate transaminase